MRGLKNRFYDVAHRITVSALMTVTVVSFGLLSHAFYNYITVTYPQRSKERQAEKELQLTREQEEKEGELLRRQTLAESLPS